MSTIDQQFIEYIVKALVGHPDAVIVTRTIDEKGVLLELTVDPEDIGRVIGKRGSTAQSLRALLRALGTKNEARYNLKIIDVDRPEGERSGAPVPATQSSVATDDTTDDIDNTDDTTGRSVEKTPETPVEKQSDLAKKTRAELADLDDLDI